MFWWEWLHAAWTLTSCWHAGAPCKELELGFCVSEAAEEVGDPWVSSAGGWEHCGAPEVWVGCPIATRGATRIGNLPPKARVLVCAPWSSSHTPLCSPWGDAEGWESVTEAFRPSFISAFPRKIEQQQLKRWSLSVSLENHWRDYSTRPLHHRQETGDGREGWYFEKNNVKIICKRFWLHAANLQEYKHHYIHINTNSGSVFRTTL